MKKLFSRICDISGTSERIPVRTTCNSRHTILSYYFELKRENTSRDGKISFEIWRFELWEVTYNSLLGIYTIPRGGSRTAAPSKLAPFVIIVNGF